MPFYRGSRIPLLGKETRWGPDIVTDGGLAAVTVGGNTITGTDSDMSGANSWNGANLGTFNINTTVAGKAYLLGDGGNDYMLLAATLETGKTYYPTLKGRRNAGAVTSIAAGTNFSVASAHFSFTPTGVEDTYSDYFVATSTTLYIGSTAGFNGIAFEIDDVTLQEVTLTNWQGWIPQATAGTLTGKAYKAPSNSANLEQVALPAIAEARYDITWTLNKIAGDAGDGITSEFGSADGILRTASGTYIDSIIAVDTDFLKFKSTDADADLKCTIDNVSIKQIINWRK